MSNISSFISINPDLLLRVSGVKHFMDLRRVESLDLHLKNTEGKIRSIECLHLVPNLLQLNLSYNAISRISGLENLTSLVELNLAENSISIIENLSGLKSLQKLNLSGNLIERIPSTIKDLCNLSHFRIARNKLYVIEDLNHLTELPELTNLRIDDNPVSLVPNFENVILKFTPNLKFLNGRHVSIPVSENRVIESVDESSSPGKGNSFIRVNESAQYASTKIEELSKRIEKITDKLLLNEEEKKSILVKYNDLSFIAEKLKTDLQQSDENLERAMIALKASNEELSLVQKKLTELQALSSVEANTWFSERKMLAEENSVLKMKLESLLKKNERDISEEKRIDQMQSRISVLLTDLQEMKSQLRLSQESNRKLKEKCEELVSEKAVRVNDLENTKGRLFSLQRNFSELQDRFEAVFKENLTLKTQLNDARDSFTIHTSGKIDCSRNQYLHEQNMNAAEVASSSDIKLSKLETAAAEILAHIIGDKMKDFALNSVQKDEIRRCCILSAFHIIIAISTMLRDGKDESSEYESETDRVYEFFRKAGEKKILTKFVENAIVGVKTLEDSTAISKEIEQLQKLRNDIEVKIENRTSQLKEKDKEIKRVQQQCVECRRQAEDTLTELESLTQRLQTGRDELLKLDSELHLMKRELEIVRNNLKESCALTEIENKSISAARERLAALRYEQSELEGSNIELKDHILKEENKLRSTKATTSEKIRYFQIQVARLAQEAKTKKETLDHLDKQRQAAEEEALNRRKELESHISLVARQHEEESRRLSSLHAQLRDAAADSERALTNKRYLEQEIQELQGKMESLQFQFQVAEDHCKRKLDYAEKQVSESSLKLKDARGQLLDVKREYSQIYQKTEEQKRLMQDLLTSHESKRTQLEAEILEIQNRCQSTSITLRQLQEQCSARQLDCQSSVSDLRANERKLEEVKKLIRDDELALEALKNEIKFNEERKNTLQRELNNMKAQADEAKVQIRAEKKAMLETLKLSEDKKRVLEKLKDEESNLQDVISRAKEIYSNSNKQRQELLAEIQSLQTKAEEEKRIIHELQSSKSSLKSEVNSISDQIEKAKEISISKSIKRQEIDVMMTKAVGELSSLQKQILQSQTVVQDLKNREEELKGIEVSIKMSCQRYNSELELLRQSKEMEESVLARLKHENQELTLNVQAMRQKFEVLSNELQSKQIELTNARNQQQNLENLKNSHELEIRQLCERRDVELTRNEAIEKQTLDLENRLKTLRNEIISLEAKYESKRSLSIEESRKLELQKSRLVQAAAELSELENEKQRTGLELEQKKQKEVLEIGRLTTLAQSKQAQFLQLAAATDKLGYSSQTNRSTYVPFTIPKEIPDSRARPFHFPLRNPEIDSIQAPIRNKENEEQNLSFASTAEGSGDEFEKNAFTSLQKAVESLRTQSVAALKSNNILINVKST